MIANTIKQLPKPHRLLLVFISVIVAVLFLLPSDDVAASKAYPLKTLEIGKKYALEIDIPQRLDGFNTLEETNNWRSYKVDRGDTLASIFSSLGLSPKETYMVSKAGKEAKKLTRIKPGQYLYIDIDEAGRFSALRYPLSKTETLYVEKTNGQYASRTDVKNVEVLYSFAQGTISSSFWNAGTSSGLTDNQIMRLAGIFGWDIDFAQEIRSGDSFNVVFEEQYIDGEFVGYGDIVAAEFVNQGDVFKAIKYSDGNFYTPDGKSMRKSFLRAPINFQYISSNFTKRRFHPVQKRWKAHRGVDYAAKVGTPVVAAGDGKVIKATYDRFNGHHVFIQHGEKYTTKYLHFSKRAVRKGQTVKQGQVIGYVGTSGMSSGPHLHYEFLVNGVHKNPRTVDLPKAKPIDRRERVKFARIAQERVQQLQNNKRIMLAMNLGSNLQITSY